jgi:hypothetical protein
MSVGSDINTAYIASDRYVTANSSQSITGLAALSPWKLLIMKLSMSFLKLWSHVPSGWLIGLPGYLTICCTGDLPTWTIDEPKTSYDTVTAI